MLFLRIFKHLLPNALAWVLTADKQLREFFTGLTGLGASVKIFYDEIFNDLDPVKTRQLDLWEQQFGLQNSGLTEQERRDRLDATWKATGGQSPRYIQDTLQNAGFDVYVHEWWEPGSEPAPDVKLCVTPRNPFFVLTDNVIARYKTECNLPSAECGEAFMECGNFIATQGYLLVNKLIITVRDYITLCGEPAMECGNTRTGCGDFDKFVNVLVDYPIPLDPAKWPYILYIGGPVFGQAAIVDVNRRDEFETLCLKICPAQQWLGILVDFPIPPVPAIPLTQAGEAIMEAGEVLAEAGNTT